MRMFYTLATNGRVLVVHEILVNYSESRIAKVGLAPGGFNLSDDPP